MNKFLCVTAATAVLGCGVAMANVAPPPPKPPAPPPTQPVDGPNKPGAVQKGVAMLGAGASVLLVGAGTMAIRRRRN